MRKRYFIIYIVLISFLAQIKNFNRLHIVFNMQFAQPANCVVTMS